MIAKLTIRQALHVFLLFLISASGAFAQDDDSIITTTTTSSSCSLFVKTTVRPVGMNERFGQVRVDATLCERNGAPIADQEIRLISTNGVVTCLPPDSTIPPGNDSLKGPCFVTNANGTITMFIFNVPFNTPGRVDATCSYHDFNLKSSGTYIIKRRTVKKK
jgi:hypothetical protein